MYNSRALQGIKLRLSQFYPMDPSGKLGIFEQRILPHLPAAYNLARWLLRNQEDAEDAVQESYIKAFRYFDGFEGTDGRAWLLAIVRNTSLSWLRKNRQVPTQAFDERVHSSGGDHQDAEQGLLKQVESRRLRGCIDALPPEYREAVILREMEELSYKEIAEVISVPIGTVMSRLSRARKRVEDCMRSKS